MIQSLLPSGVQTCAVRGDVAAPLFASEEDAVRGAVAKRRAEFTTVRHCARIALEALGAPVLALPPGPDRAPLWPAGIAGSLTHCTGYRAAAVAWAEDRLLSLGIDAEPAEALPGDVVRLVASQFELTELAKLRRGRPDVPWERVLFSAKESVFKAWWALNRRWLGFEDAEVQLVEDGTARVRILVPQDAVAEYHARWAVERETLLTAAWTNRV